MPKYKYMYVLATTLVETMCVVWLYGQSNFRLLLKMLTNNPCSIVSVDLVLISEIMRDYFLLSPSYLIKFAHVFAFINSDFNKSLSNEIEAFRLHL